MKAESMLPRVAWLAADLNTQPAAKPIIIRVHIPLVSAIDNYTPVPATPPAHHGNTVVNSSEVTQLFMEHNVLAVFQGHTHINERGLAWRAVHHQRCRLGELVARHPAGYAGGFYGSLHPRWQVVDALRNLRFPERRSTEHLDVT